jgi:threonine dehydrogenase-like Zn-dependent dehydrogenase
MLALHITHSAIAVRHVPKPVRPPGYALIQMTAAGICNTDLELRRGYYGFEGIPGHEFVGRVVEADNAKWIGSRVAGEINLACGECDWCRRGLGRHCPTRSVLGIVRHPGAFAEYLTLPECNLHAIPDSLPDEQAVFLEPLAAACEILNQVDLAKHSRVAVLGDGKLGLLIAQVLQDSLAGRGAHVVHYGRHSEKLKIAAAFGTEPFVVTESTVLPVAAFTLVVDATGSSKGLRTAVSLVEPCGTVVMKSTVHGYVSIDTAPLIVNEITLIGSRCGRFAPALALLEQGRVSVTPLLSAEFRLSTGAKAFAEAGKKGVLKVLLRQPS